MGKKQSSKPEGRLIILSAPSGAGKTSLAKALAESINDLTVSVSHTTRPARALERDGVDYHFVGEKIFKKMIANSDFLEYARVFSHLYGTAKKPVEGALKLGQSVVLDIDWQGARKVRALIPEAVSVFIVPPSLNDLERRLFDRKRDSSQIIQSRMSRAISEISHYSEFDYVIVNAEFGIALQELQGVFLHHEIPKSGIYFDPATFL
ncbi:MAG: guanylate kinase [Acidiferrobacteraceae bacterium]|jgi:guanylate kinase|nr:guanylate kinase [Acidiferrobacteraceae bacterium]|tara:strand:- start:1425 stop:2045 length:621 start_codon:yes stop_codon:yes gene_type:complete